MFNPTETTLMDAQSQKTIIQAARWSTQNQCKSQRPWTDLGPKLAFVRSFVVLSRDRGPFRKIDFGLPNASFEDPRLIAIDTNHFVMVVSVA